MTRLDMLEIDGMPPFETEHPHVAVERPLSLSPDGSAGLAHAAYEAYKTSESVNETSHEEIIDPDRGIAQMGKNIIALRNHATLGGFKSEASINPSFQPK